MRAWFRQHREQAPEHEPDQRPNQPPPAADPGRAGPDERALPEPPPRITRPRPTDPEATKRFDINEVVEEMGEHIAYGTAFAVSDPGPGGQRQALVNGPVDAAIEIEQRTGIEVDARDILAAAVLAGQTDTAPSHAADPDAADTAGATGATGLGRRSATLREVASWLGAVGAPRLETSTEAETGDDTDAAARRAEALLARQRRIWCFASFLEPAAPDFWTRWREELRAESERMRAAQRQPGEPDEPDGSEQPGGTLGFDPGPFVEVSEQSTDLALLSAEVGEQWEARRGRADPTPGPPTESAW